MGKTSSIVKERYNRKVYTQIAFRLPKDLVAAFKAKCATDGISQAAIIRAAIEDYLNKTE